MLIPLDQCIMPSIKFSYPGTVQGEAMSSIPSVTSVTVEGWICSPEATNELAMIGWSSGVSLCRIHGASQWICVLQR